MQIPKNNKLLENARKLRKEMTPQELRLWYRFLQKYPIKFFKQRIIGNYIVDFYCSKAKLVIEIDGSQHYEDDTKVYDEERTMYLQSLGLQVIRFSNRDINCHFHSVCEYIDQIVKERFALSADCVGTSPKGRG